MPSAGSVHVDVLPDLKRFGPQLRSQLTQVGRRAGRESGNTSGDAFAKRFAVKVNAIPDPKIKVSAQTGVALSQLARVQAAADRLDGRTVTIDIATRGAGRAQAAMAGAGRGGTGRGGGRGGSGGGRQRPFTDMSPAMSALAWIGGPAAVPAVGAMTGALGALASGFTAAGTGAGVFAAAAVPAVRDVAGAIELQKAAAEGGEEATEAYTEAMSELTPAARGTVTAWGDLTSAYGEWQRSLQSDTLPVVTRGIGLLQSQLPALTPIVRSSAAGFDSLLDSSERALAGEHWERFTSFAARQAEPSIGILGRSVGNLAVGFTGLVVSMEPLWNRVGPGMEDLTARFAAWSNESSNFTGFIGWTIQNGPTFVSMFGAFAGAAVDVGVALGPLGTVYAKGLTVLAEAVSAVAETAPWLIQVAVAAKTAHVAFGLLGRVNTGLIQPLQNTTTSVREMATTMRTATTAGTGMRTALSGLTGALGGPWGIALAAATVGLGLFIAKKHEATQAAQEYARAIEADGGALADSTREQLANNLAKEGVVDLARDLGISLNDVTDALLGEGDAHARVNEELQSYIDSAANADAARDSGAITEQADAARELQGILKGENETITEGIQLSKDSKAAKEALGVQDQTLTGQQNTLNGALAEGAYQARDLRTALNSLTGANVSATEAEYNFNEAVRNATSSVNQNGATLDKNTDAGKANHDQLGRLRDRTNDFIDAKYNETGSVESAIKVHERGRKKFIEVGKQMGLTQDDAEELADEYLGIPAEVKTALEVNAKGRWERIAEVSAQHPTGWATGGAIRGPGTATSDSIPAMLSDGEFVEPASTVDYYGPGLFEALRHRAIPREVLPGFATGGRVTRGQGSTPWGIIDDHRLDVRSQYGAMLRNLIGAIGDDAAEKWKNAVAGPMGLVRLAEASIGKYPESGGNNTNAITRWYGMNGAPWCAMWISWLFAQTGASQALGRAARTAWTGDYYTSGMSRAGRPMPGDVAVYGTDHVNLIASPGGGRRIGGNQSNNVTAGSGYSGGSIFRPNWGAVGFARGGLVDILDQDRREDGMHPLLKSLRGMASGGLASGWTVVGEEGPELARFDDPARVYSSSESARLLSEARRAGSQAHGGDGASSPLIGEYHQHLHDSQATLREAMGDLTHTLRVVNKGGLYSD